MGDQLLEIIAAGTASWDIINYAQSESAGDEKPRVDTLDQAGGVGYNAIFAAAFMARLYDQEANLTLITHMGAEHPKHNRYQDFVLEEIDNPVDMDPLHINVLDARSDDPTVSTPRIVVNVDADGNRQASIPDRDLTRSYKRGLHGEAEPKALTLSQRVRDEIEKLSVNSDVAILSSRLPEESMPIALNASHTVLDLNSEVKAFIESPLLNDIIQNSDDILVPAETKLPGMIDADPDELIARLRNEYGQSNIAISDGTNPVRLIENGEELEAFSLPDIPGECVDSLGCGDTRTGAFSFARAQGSSFSEAVMFGSTISSISSRFPGRSWSYDENREAFLKLVQDALNDVLPDSHLTQNLREQLKSPTVSQFDL